MKKLKFTKALILGICITVFSSTAAFAQTGGGQQNVVQGQQTADESRLIEKQKEIDQFVFEKHAEEIADKGFTVTNTGPVGNFVEIGITPFNEVNAEYLYESFGREMVKVVEGQQAVLMTATAGASDTAVSSPAMDVQQVNESMLEKQREIDQYLFEEHKDKIAEEGFKITHTAPFENYVEIGITPYSEANAEFLYEVFGKDGVKVVEGQQAVTLGIGADSDNAVETATALAQEKDNTGMASPMIIVLICAAGLVILGGTVVVTRKLKAANK